MKTLKGKVVLITGAASGIGKAIAEKFAMEGASVIATDLNQEGLKSLSKNVKINDGEITTVVGDVSLEDDVMRMMNTAQATERGIDILVNNAGILDDFIPVAEISTELWNKVMGVNINGPFLLCRLAVPEMLKKGNGSIINISSVGGLYGSRAGAAYTASKHALIGLTKNIAYQYGDKGIRCNAIAPGGVKTNIGNEMHPNSLGFAKLNLGLATNIRMGEPDEIAEIALFLASEKSGLINGSVIVADAGWTAY
ncbi:SDR family oxidoreductase [soil metagenome]